MDYEEGDPRDQPLAWQVHNIEAEQAIIGAVLINNDAYQYAEKYITHEHFYEPIHQTIWGATAQLIEAGKLADPLILASFIPNDLVLPGVTTRQYLAKVVAGSTTILNAADYARTIRELADRRRLAEIGQALQPADATPAAGLASEAITHLDAVVAAHADNAAPAMSMRKAIALAVDSAAKAYQNNGAVDGIPTTLRDLDVKLGALERGDLVVLGGRPGMGKSAVITTMLRRQAMMGFQSMFASLEMKAEQLAQRVLSDAMYDLQFERLPYASMRRGSFHERLFQSLTDAARETAELIGDKIHIEQQPYLTLSQIATRARQRKRKHGLDLLAVDHLDLVQPTGRYKGNKVYELGEITAGLKALAKELGIVVVLLCQLNRSVEARDDKRPILADLRSSGSIEQDADTVIFLFRKEYYLGNAEPRPGTEEHVEWQQEMEANHNLLQAIIAKQRMGPTGTVDLFCDIANNAVRDLDHQR